MIAGCRNHWAIQRLPRSLYFPRNLILGKGSVGPVLPGTCWRCSTVQYKHTVPLSTTAHSSVIAPSHPDPDASQSRASSPRRSRFSVPPAVLLWVEADATVMGKLKAEWRHGRRTDEGRLTLWLARPRGPVQGLIRLGSSGDSTVRYGTVQDCALLLPPGNAI